MSDWENGGEVRFWAFVAVLVLGAAAFVVYQVREDRTQRERLNRQARRHVAWDTHPTFCECEDCRELPL